MTLSPEHETARESGTHTEAAGRSVTGPRRRANEDAFGLHLAHDEGALLVVADGVSGAQAGEVASRTAVDETLRAFIESPAKWAGGKRLYRAAQAANIRVFDRATVVPELRGMTTTLTAALVASGELHAVHVGDSRLYLVRDGAIDQKTKDHTLTGERVRLGLLSAARALHHPDRGTLTRSLGNDLVAALDRLSFPVQTGDVIALCTDGLYNVVSDEEILAAVVLAGPGPTSLASACDALIAAAEERGTSDNVTVALARVRVAPPLPPSMWNALRDRLRNF